jgi:hypothetical protein
MGFYSCDGGEAGHVSSNAEDKQWEEKDYSKAEMTPNEFATWCADEENSLTKERIVSEMKYRLSFLPAESMALLELRGEDYDAGKFNKALENYSEMTYFNFRVEVTNGKSELLKYQLTSPGQYEERVKYYSFQIEKDICLVQGSDTIQPGLCQFERIFEVAPYANLMFAFDNKKFDRSREFTIVYNDRIFEKGLIKYNYKSKQLINLPNITRL